MSRSEPRRRPTVDGPPTGTAAPYLVPAVPEVAALLGAAERVLVACDRAEDAHADRAIRLAATLDPVTLPVGAVVGPGLPVPLARRIALRALQRLAVALRPPSVPDVEPWTTPDGRDVVPFRAVHVDTTDLALLGQAAAQLTHRRRSREGTLGAAMTALGDGSDEPPDHRHPAALGCLLAVVVPVVDPVAEAVHSVAVGRDPVLDGDALAAHQDLARRVLARLRTFGR